MTLLYSDPRFLDHRTGQHPENPSRLEHITRLLDSSGLAERCRRPTWQPASAKEIAAVHEPGYIEEVAEFIRRGAAANVAAANVAAANVAAADVAAADIPVQIEADTVVSRGSLDAALLAAGAVRDAVSRVVAGEDTTALCLVRPPGHHARPAAAMGFCLFNNVAIGARMAVDELKLDRVLVVDWDVHHGNGTQESFWRDEQIGFLSIHRYPFYPGTGDADETGSGPGLGATLNLPVPFGTPRANYLAGFTGELDRFADRIKPQLVLVSAGFDSHRTDPIGSLGLEVEDFATLTEAVRAVAAEHAGGRIVSVLEGGYNPPVLAECVAAHLSGLLAPSPSP